MRKSLFIVIAIAVVLGGIGVWFWQRNTFSKEVLRFEILGPKDAEMGQEITYIVKWKNNGNVALENPLVTFEYPQNSLPSKGDPLRVIKKLDSIYPGQESTLEFKARLFGAQGDIKTAKAHIAYNPKNLQARYEGDTVLTTTIASVPLNFDVDLSSRVEREQLFTFALNYFSNFNYPLAGARIKIDYPDGFEFQGATPNPIGQNEWPLGVLNKGKGGRITIKGRLNGDLGEVKNFHATLGTWNNGEFTLFKEITRGVEMAEPKIQIVQTINGDSVEGIHPGDMLHYEISFRNVSDKDLENLFLIASLNSPFFDFNNLNAQGGQFKSGDQSIVWEAKDNASLQFLRQGQEGRVEFWIKTKESIDLNQTGSSRRNFKLYNKIVLSDAIEEFETKVNSKLIIDQAAYYQDEVFGNEGPLPPRAGEKTTYTILWKAQNLYNDVKNVKVKALLPQGLELTGKIFPDNSSFTFDSQSREIVWTVGDMGAGAGVTGTPLSVAFQVGLTPSFAQRGSTAQLMGEARITGDDTWTNQVIGGLDSALDTLLSDDTSSQGKGVVQ